MRVAVHDVMRVVPFAALLVVPGGSVLLPLVVRFAPTLLPSTFSTDSADEKHRETEVVTRILTLEKTLTLAVRKREKRRIDTGTGTADGVRA